MVNEITDGMQQKMRAIVVPDGDQTSVGNLTFRGETFRAALGRGGVRIDKHEGDGGTPAGVLPLRRVLYRPDRVAAPLSAVPVLPLAPADGWCDDPAYAAYNKPVRLPIDASAEKLWRDDALYDIIGVLGWNDQPVRPGLGSAIFLHVAAADFAPTEGCIALARNDLQHVLAAGLTDIVVRL
jgi:L,D-peptidoglycan transpeptidase YkuD (ErfK/YbiS/YcfS/YnhG family)